MKPDRFDCQWIAAPIADFLVFQGAKIESVVTESTAFNTGVSASGLNVTLDVPIHSELSGQRQKVNWPEVQSSIIELFRETIRARVQATLIPPDYCKRQVGKLDTVDGDGNLVKIKFPNNTNVAGHVLKIGDEVYGIIMAKALTTRHRVLLDRPLADKTLPRGTPVFVCGVGHDPLPSFNGVTVVSNPLDDDPNESISTHESVRNLHARITQTALVGEGCDRFHIDMVCGLYVDPNKASMR